MALQTAPLIGMTESSNSVPGSSDRHAQLLTVGNFEINFSALYALKYQWSYIKIISHKLKNVNSRVYYFEAARIIQIKIRAQQDLKYLVQIRFYFHSREPLKKSAKH